ncbi:DUF3267 domain-containing protein [Virgibacillus sp. NKC19-16]|uniref:DUF3267 domain-containing protein n=1 Tax=Virgibacillus salidurans TaxID=2831673 RepID=UPI001F46D724|nr:DUF3267 domain-containing protein [Virgibacillus sp. NKC19-16]UJL47371.1 DUF3267 domain-containing protein [Virgibacillus sp. NKC19-16]
MQLFKELNVLEDKKLYYKINLFSLALLVVTIAVVLLAHLILIGEVHLSFSISNLIWIMGILLISLPIHELFHGIFFKAFSESGTIKYGFEKGMLYASNPGVFYTKRQFSTIALAPFVLNSLLFFLLFLFGVDGTIIWSVFILHTSSCAGDFWYIYEMIKNPTITHCEDTPVGIKLFVDV